VNGSETDRPARRGDREVPQLHVVTDDGVLARADFLATAVRIARMDRNVAIHIRGPRTDGGTLHHLAAELRRRTEGAPGWLVVNDRVDVALSVRADAIQLGSRSLRPEELPVVATGLRIGVSVHAPDELRTTEGGMQRLGRSRVDWWLVGTVFPTPSHPGRAGGGRARVAAFSATASAATIAIGGITPERVGGVLDAGAHGAAVLRGVWDATDPVAAVQRYLSMFAPDVNPGPNPDPNPGEEPVP
jgi:thiazole tautomerase (transcriptional regulator TenI)